MFLTKRLATATLMILTLGAVESIAQDEIYLEITGPGLRRVAVAAPALMVLPGTPAEVAMGFQKTLDRDLSAAAPIAVVDRRLYALVEDDPRPQIMHQRWRSIGAQFLLSGTVVRAGGQIVVEARLVDLVSGEFAFAKRYRAGISAAQVVAHTLANDLVQVFTGRPGPFLSRIAFISDRSGSAEVWVMDWDGANPKQLTKHGSIALAPAWDPAGKHLVFTSYLRGAPALFVLTPQEGYLRLLHDQGGVNSSATFSPDGERIAFASSTDGNVDIYEMALANGTPRRLTTARGIDTQPAWAPNGRQIAFTSTRSGSPQIYLMNVDGTNVRRLSFGGEFHDESTWTYDGTRVACTTRVNGRFQLTTINTITAERTVLAGPGNNESPVFSPDGSMLAFASDRSGEPQIFITDADGVPRQLTTEGKNHSPTWVGESSSP
jgi:TolB protein